MGIFCFNVDSKLLYIFDNEEDKNNSALATAPVGCYTYVTVSDDDYDNVKNGIKEFTGNSGNLTYEDSVEYYEDSKDLQQRVTHNYTAIDEWVKAVPDHPNKDSWVAYSQSLKNFDYSQVTFPSEKHFSTLCSEQGISYKSLLQKI